MSAYVAFFDTAYAEAEFAPGGNAATVGFAPEVAILESWPTLVPGPSGPTGPQGPAGIGSAPIELVAAQEIRMGQPLRVRFDGLFEPANAAAFNTATVAGVAAEDAISGFICKASTSRVSSANWTDVCGTPGLVPGATYFLSDEAPGKLTTVPPQTAGSCVVKIGVALNGTTLIVETESAILL